MCKHVIYFDVGHNMIYPIKKENKNPAFLPQPENNNIHKLTN